jgi:hypothetical protein
MSPVAKHLGENCRSKSDQPHKGLLSLLPEIRDPLQDRSDPPLLVERWQGDLKIVDHPASDVFQTDSTVSLLN